MPTNMKFNRCFIKYAKNQLLFHRQSGLLPLEKRPATNAQPTGSDYHESTNWLLGLRVEIDQTIPNARSYPTPLEIAMKHTRCTSLRDDQD